MGLDIRTLKLDKYYGETCTNETDDCWYVHDLNFNHINHLTEFKEGYYEAELGKAHFSMPYSSFNRFRRCICKMAIGVEYDELLDNVTSFLNEPFIEMLWFADNEGCFDYKIAQKLLEDFNKYKSEAEKLTLCDYDFYNNYLIYIDLLEECIKFEGVVDYG